MYNYTIFEHYNENVLYKGSSLYRVLDCHDNRQRDRTFPKSHGTHFLTEDIHYTFFKQLTEQVSLKISQIIKMDFPKDAAFYYCDRYLLDFTSFFCIKIILRLNEYHSFDVWVKCKKNLSLFNLSEENELVFELCNKEESQGLFIQRFGHGSGYWTDELQEYLEISKRKKRTSLISSYPDIVLKCKSRWKITDEQKSGLNNTLETFITEWNSSNEFEPIHYFDLLESTSVREISIHIDFGNCEPEALEKLYYVLLELDFINKIELG